MARGEYEEAERWTLEGKLLNDKMFARYGVADSGDNPALGALSMARGRPQALAYLEEARAQSPRNWKVFLHPGSVHAAIGLYYGASIAGGGAAAELAQ